MNRQTAMGVVNDGINGEGSTKAEWLKMDEI
jgi:hypothetical protein